MCVCVRCFFFIFSFQNLLYLLSNIINFSALQHSGTSLAEIVSNFKAIGCYVMVPPFFVLFTLVLLSFGPYQRFMNVSLKGVLHDVYYGSNKKNDNDIRKESKLHHRKTIHSHCPTLSTNCGRNETCLEPFSIFSYRFSVGFGYGLWRHVSNKTRLYTKHSTLTRTRSKIVSPI